MLGNAVAEQHSVIVYGATGRVGSRVLTEALSRDHKVTSVSRSANSGRVQGDVLDADSVRELGPKAPRLIYVGGAGSLEVKPGITYADSLGGIAKAMMPASVEQEIAGQVLTLEYLRTVNDVRWTYISPAKKFSPGKRTGGYRIGGDKMLLDKKGKSRISMEDFAVALVDEIENAAHINERISVAY